MTTYYKFGCVGAYNVVTIYTYPLAGCQGEPRVDDPLVKTFWKPTGKTCDVASVSTGPIGGVYASSRVCVPPGAANWGSGGWSDSGGGGGDSSSNSGAGTLTQTSTSVAIGVSVAVLLLAAAAACYYYYNCVMKRSTPMAQQAEDQENQVNQETSNPNSNPTDKDDVPSPVLGTAAPALPRASALVSNSSTYLHHAPGRMTIIPEQSNPIANPTPTQPRLSGLAEKSGDEEL